MTEAHGVARQQKLFKVTCRGMHESHGIAYVVASDAGAAYERVYSDLSARGLGFTHDRALQCVELMADDAEFPDCDRRLYLETA